MGRAAERDFRRVGALNATTKFYSGFLVAVALVIAVSFYAGYRVGAGAHLARHPAAAHAAPAP